MNVLHPGADGDILRTHLLTVQALYAQVGAGFFRDKRVGYAGAADVLVHDAFVINAQIFGNVDALSAGQAIFTGGTITGFVCSISPFSDQWSP